MISISRSSQVLTWDVSGATIVNGDMSATLTSKVIYMGAGSGLSVTLYSASDTHVGVVTVQASDDQLDGSEHWNDVDIGALEVRSGSAFNARIQLAVAASKIRVIYTRSSGSGTLVGSFTVKEDAGAVPITGGLQDFRSERPVVSGSMGADLTSDVLDLGAHRHLHLQMESASGTREGLLYIQRSSDGTTYYNVPIVNAMTGIPAAALTVTASTDFYEDAEIETSARYLRLFFDRTSGTGTLNVWATIK